MATRLLPPGYQQLDANGSPVSGAKLYTYSAGTTTPKATYSDAGLTILNANPVEADAAGRFGDIFAATGSYALVMETPAGAPIWDADPVDGATGSTASPGAGVRNLVTNGDFSAIALTTSTGVDGAAVADLWYALNQSNNTTVALQTLQQDGIPNNIRVTQANASAQRYGIAQVVPAADSYRARGSSVTLSGKIRHSLAAAIRYAVLAWTGTADSVTKDVVADWTSGTYTAGGFFNSTTLTVVGVGSITPTANTWTDITALTGSVSSSATNLIVFFWTEGTTAQNATLDVTQVQLEVASAATAYEFTPQWLAAAPNGWQTIKTQVASTSANIDFVLPSGFSSFKLVAVDVLLATDGATLCMRTSTDGGSSFHSGGTDYTRNGILLASTSTIAGFASNDSYMFLSGGMDSGGGLSGEYLVTPGSASQPFRLAGTVSYRDDGSGSAYASIGQIGGIYNTGGAQNAIRILATSGNISAGRFTLLGLR